MESNMTTKEVKKAIEKTWYSLPIIAFQILIDSKEIQLYEVMPNQGTIVNKQHDIKVLNDVPLCLNFLNTAQLQIFMSFY